MTLIAGIFNRKGRPISDATCDVLRRSISRNAVDEVQAFKDGRSFFVKVDIGAFDEPAVVVDPNGAVSLLTGEALLSLDEGPAWQSRQKDLALIHKQCSNGGWDVLGKAEGTFAVVHYDPHKNTLDLIADKLGLRPLYYWASEDTIVFASALRTLEDLAEIPKKMDLRAVTEIAAFGLPLGRRTPYANVSILRPGEIVRINESSISSTRYWLWDEIEPSQDSEPARLREVYDRFQVAVSRRNRNDRTTFAYLSGGLDSRCIVGALAGQGIRVHTFNFARAGTQDHLFGNEFARHMQTVHQSVPKDRGDRVPDYSLMMADVWRASIHRNQWPPERPGIVWSGGGGSQALGHLHINEKIIELMRGGETEAAIQEFLRMENIHIPRKLFNPEVLTVLADVVKDGIREELSELHSPDAGRDFYLFSMLNEQRRQIAQHFENLDLHRLEFQLPFYDGAFLASVIATPIDLCLRHKFYTKWLANFPPAVTAVPWQVYPNHELCPLAVPPELTDQWNKEYQDEERAAQRRALVKRATQLLSVPDFPHELLNKRNLRLAAWMHASGLRDYEYAIEAAQTYYTYWRKCDGMTDPRTSLSSAVQA
jgi:asparagine synthase (glutamine-hydrolysing)